MSIIETEEVFEFYSLLKSYLYSKEQIYLGEQTTVNKEVLESTKFLIEQYKEYFKIKSLKKGK